MQVIEQNQTKSYFLRTNNLSVGYRSGFPVVSDVSFDIQPGKTYALIGGNGAGKTTVFKTLTGLIPPLSGSIDFPELKSSSYVPQAKKMRLDFPLSVKEVLLMPKNIGFSFLPKKKFTDEELFLIERTGIRHFLKKQISECSGGQLQRVLILRSLFTKANLVFLDEPMDSLDHESRELFQEILEEYIHEANRSLFVITHSLTHDWRQGFSEIFEIDEGKFYKISEGQKPPHCHHHD
ncbi:metal ABC transporter ATP-binding protein [Leptospira idonii]|uniref:ATP-binding cassette domain-containing protein n=1 Tax=Leptospira idonii TaxID=1193500 RepID=A0A4R9LWU2_9LEPT|nr:ATP-binding cassette domain-containing protein [Leptospira idonii]TGN17567.1 ATP-binding cassette domain-containing protein [Leptospira idonii]